MLRNIGHSNSELGSNEVRDYFDDDSSRFAENRWLGSQLAKEDYKITRKYLLEFLALTDKDDVLEVGCGPGIWTELVSKMCRCVTAVDISPGMLEEAKKRVSSENVTYHRANFAEYQGLNSYDRILSVRVIEYLPDPARAVRNMYALTRESGRAVVVTKTHPTLITVRSRFWQTLFRARSSSLEPLMKRIPPFKLAKLFLQSGYRNVDIYPVVLRLPFFVHGHYLLPWASERLRQRYEMAMLRFCNRIAQKALSARAIIRKLLLPFSETYLIVAYK